MKKNEFFCGWWFGGHGKMYFSSEKTLVLLNSNAITLPECEVWKDFCNLRRAFDNRICFAMIIFMGSYE